MKRNITLRIDEALLAEARALAADRRTSVTGLLTALLEDHVRQSIEYDRAMTRAIKRMDDGFDLSFVPGGRDELHER